MPSRELGQTWFIGHDPVQIDFFTPRYRPQIHPARTKRKDTSENVIIGSEWIDEDVVKLTGLKYEYAQGFFIFRSDLSAVSAAGKDRKSVPTNALHRGILTISFFGQCCIAKTTSTRHST